MCEPTEEEFSGAMMKFINNPQLKKELGSHGHTRVTENFSFDAFTRSLNDVVSVTFIVLIDTLMDQCD